MLSVIISCYNAEKTIEDCLLSLENQRTDNDFEIIVVDSSSDNTPEIIKEKFPSIKLFKFSKRKFPGDARNIGISVARGEIIAFFDADCRADKKWVDEILKAHQSSHLAIGGSVANGNTYSYVSWAHYFSEFSQWMPNKTTTWLADIAGANMSYKREVFEKFGHFIEGTYCSDTEFHWRLGQNGHQLQFVPSVLVYHHSIDNLWRFLKHEYLHGRSFARVRVETANFFGLKRFCYAVCFPLIAVKLFLRVALLNVKNRIYLLHYFKTLPLVTLGLIFWSFGECVGYMKG